MERETILFDVADNVATITLNRPDSLNSFNEAMAAEMTWAWETSVTPTTSTAPCSRPTATAPSAPASTSRAAATGS